MAPQRCRSEAALPRALAAAAAAVWGAAVAAPAFSGAWARWPRAAPAGAKAAASAASWRFPGARATGDVALRAASGSQEEEEPRTDSAPGALDASGVPPVEIQALREKCRERIKAGEDPAAVIQSMVESGELSPKELLRLTQALGESPGQQSESDDDDFIKRGPFSPATYEALADIRLRDATVDEDGYLKFTGVNMDREIHKGDIIRAVDFLPGDDDVLALRLDEQHDGQWIVDTGVAGPMRGKKLVKQVSALRSRGAQAVSVMSLVDLPEMAPPDATGDGPEVKVAEVAADFDVSELAPSNFDVSELAPSAPPDGEIVDVEEEGTKEKTAAEEILSDPKVVALLKSAGLDPEDLLSNPAILKQLQDVVK